MRCRASVFVLLLLYSCSTPEQQQDKPYTDLKGFFTLEAGRLAHERLRVDKTVSRNGSAERKKDLLPDWKTELDLFRESDINKPAWKTSYQVREDTSGVSYTAVDTSLKTRYIHIRKDNNGNIAAVRISNRVKNYLYQSSEELEYVRGKEYSINKKQSVLILGSNEYRVRGVFHP